MTHKIYSQLKCVKDTESYFFIFFFYFILLDKQDNLFSLIIDFKN